MSNDKRELFYDQADTIYYCLDHFQSVSCTNDEYEQCHGRSDQDTYCLEHFRSKSCHNVTYDLSDNNHVIKINTS